MSRIAASPVMEKVYTGYFYPLGAEQWEQLAASFAESSRDNRTHPVQQWRLLTHSPETKEVHALAARLRAALSPAKLHVQAAPEIPPGFAQLMPEP